MRTNSVFDCLHLFEYLVVEDGHDHKHHQEVDEEQSAVRYQQLTHVPQICGTRLQGEIEICEPLIKDPPRKGQPLYKGQPNWFFFV